MMRTSAQSTDSLFQWERNVPTPCKHVPRLWSILTTDPIKPHYFAANMLQQQSLALWSHLHKRKCPDWALALCGFDYIWPSWCGSEPRSARLGSRVGLSAARIALYVICCQEQRIMILCLEKWWRQTSNSCVVQITDVSIPVRAKCGPALASSVNGPYSTCVLNQHWKAYTPSVLLTCFIPLHF